MPSDSVLLPLGSETPAAMLGALRAAGLPCDDLDQAAFFELQGAQGPIGWAGLERHGDEALLRSVVVSRRGAGTGIELMLQIMRAASDQGLKRLWLLTETAEPFFARLGFRPAPRDEAPEAIRQSSEFANVCPASAVCMTRTLSA